jgi:hypothetical protein
MRFMGSLLFALAFLSFSFFGAQVAVPFVPLEL